MRFALAFHPDHVPLYLNGRTRIMPMEIPEDRAAAARGQGWIVLGADSEVYPDVDVDVNLQSNVRRLDEPKDYGEQ